MPYVYILKCRDGTLYTGSAKDLNARLRTHHDGRGARYTRGRRPVELIWQTETESWSDALKLEYRIKRLSRQEKEAMVCGDAPPPRIERVP